MIPSLAPVGKESIDPSDVADFVINLFPLLEENEQFASIAFTVPSDSAALGFKVLTVAPHAPLELDNSSIRIWVTVEEASRGLPAWNGVGTPCAVEFTATTNSEPARTWQRTIAIKVAHK